MSVVLVWFSGHWNVLLCVPSIVFQARQQRRLGMRRNQVAKLGDFEMKNRLSQLCYRRRYAVIESCLT